MTRHNREPAPHEPEHTTAPGHTTARGPEAAGRGCVLVVRLDGAGDVLLAGPAVRAVRAHAAEVVFLAGPDGRDAAELLPGVDRVVEWVAPWIAHPPPPVSPDQVAALTGQVRDVDEALILTSFHQSALPLALLLRLAGVGRIAAISNDYPGSLLDVRHQVDEDADVPEAERMLALARTAGFEPPDGDDGRLAVRHPLPDVTELVRRPLPDVTRLARRPLPDLTGLVRRPQPDIAGLARRAEAAELERRADAA